jgi:ATP-binding cassette subfamily F protein 3
MPLLAAEGLGKRFGADWCFRGARFTLEPGARVGLVGANGTGKTTLLRILLGQLDHDGEVSRRRDLRVAYLEQNPAFPDGLTVREAARHATTAVAELERRQDEIHHALAEPGLGPEETGRLLDRLAALERRFESLGGHDLEHRTDAVLDGLGFPAARFDVPVEALSGGERNRLALACLLLDEPDLWLLDEPTNHLDVDGVVYFEQFLVDSSAASVVVSHDRRFLDTVTTETWHLRGESLEVLPAPYTRAMELSAERLEAAQKAYEVQQSYIAKQEEFIRRYGAGQRSKEARGRATRLARLERMERPDDRARVMALRFPPGKRLGDRVLTVAGLSIGFGDRTLFRSLELEVEPGETLAVMGPNGSGKTSLLRALLAAPAETSGPVRWGPSVASGVLAQHEVFPDPALTPLAYLHGLHRGLTERELRDLLGAMRFPGDAAERPVSVLSGGEQKRLVMTRLLMEGNNVLLLDEPTNHLDIGSREALELALSAFDGSLIVVSHDRYFVDRLADRVLWLEDGGWRITRGGFAEAWAARCAERARVRAEAARAARAARPQPAAPPAAAKPKRKKGPHARLKTPELEASIIGCEGEIAALEARFADPETMRDGERVKSVQAEIAAARARLTELEEEYWSRSD